MAFPVPAARDAGEVGTAAASHNISLSGLGTLSSGDGILLAVTDDGADGMTIPTSGWTVFLDQASGGGGGHTRQIWAWKKSDGTETSVTVDIDGSETIVWRTWKFASADITDWATTPPEGTITTGSPSNPTDSPDPPSHTVSWASGEDNWWCASWGADSDQAPSSTWPSGTEAASQFSHNSHNGSGACSAGYAEEYTIQLDTWDPTNFFNDGGSDQCVEATVAVRPAAGTPSTNANAENALGTGTAYDATVQTSTPSGIILSLLASL